MRSWIGTSGWSYDEWKGSFYPDDIKSDGMLSYYAGRLSAVEVNNTFYRLPKRTVLEGWQGQVPEDFRFVLKASRRITHNGKLGEDAYEPLAFLATNHASLGEQGGPILFQTPPWLKKNPDLLRAFLGQVPGSLKAAFEFRSTSWFDDEIFELLSDADAALVLADTDKPEKDPPPVATASWGYLRLRKEAYEPGDLDQWVERIQEQSWSDCFVFFKHEDAGAGPRLAGDFRQRLHKGDAT